MHFKRVFESTTADFAQAMELYERSFPAFEKRALHDQVEALGDKDYSFCIVQNESAETLGLLFTWETAQFLYIEHFAVLEELRGQNIGGRILEKVKAEYDKPIILEIDPPVDVVSLRRKAFYERHGFVMSHYEHLHPPYKETDTAYMLKVLSYPEIDNTLYTFFYDFFRNRVMYYSFSRQE